MVTEATYCLHYLLEVFRAKVLWPQVLNHVIEDEEGKLLALWLRATEAIGYDLVPESLNEASHAFLMSPEETAHELSCSYL